MQANHVSSVGLGHMVQPMALTLLNVAGEKEGVRVFDERTKRAAPLGALSEGGILGLLVRPGCPRRCRPLATHVAEREVRAALAHCQLP